LNQPFGPDFRLHRTNWKDLEADGVVADTRLVRIVEEQQRSDARRQWCHERSRDGGASDIV
jgi:hypothetical protein